MLISERRIFQWNGERKAEWERDSFPIPAFMSAWWETRTNVNDTNTLYICGGPDRDEVEEFLDFVQRNVPFTKRDQQMIWTWPRESFPRKAPIKEYLRLPLIRQKLHEVSIVTWASRLNVETTGRLKELTGDWTLEIHYGHEPEFYDQRFTLTSNNSPQWLFFSQKGGNVNVTLETFNSNNAGLVRETLQHVPPPARQGLASGSPAEAPSEVAGSVQSEVP